MDFKTIAENKIDELSNELKNQEKAKPKSEFSKFVETKKEIIQEDIDIELSQEDDKEIQGNVDIELIDGFLGELNYIPNPLECGTNAMYRNINEGKVYKKSKDNLWELFIQDGKPGKDGRNQIVGSGVGVEEVKRIITQKTNYVGSFDSLSALPQTANPGQFATTYDGKLYVWSA